VALFLIRHGETGWSRTHRHTGRTDVPLTAAGEVQARALGRRLNGVAFAAVWTSPAARARRTADLARLMPTPRVLEDLAEFDYGRYDGLTGEAIRRQRPGWELWRDGSEGGESPAGVLQRAQRALAVLESESPPGPLAVVSHGHLLRALTVAYLGLPIAAASGFVLDVASISILDRDHGSPAVHLWNLAEPGPLGRQGAADPAGPRPAAPDGETRGATAGG